MTTNHTPGRGKTTPWWDGQRRRIVVLLMAIILAASAAAIGYAKLKQFESWLQRTTRPIQIQI